MISRSQPLSLDVKRQIDQICLSFEAAWQEIGRPPLGPFLSGVAEPELSTLVRELLLLDIDYRQRRGQTLQFDDYATMLSDHRSVLEAVFRECGLCVTGPADRQSFGDYELLDEIARGGMGVIYRAFQRGLDRIVALKMILAGRLASRDDIERFRHEARVAAALQHPNIVAIHEIGQFEGQHFFAMDYVEGQSLAALVRDGPLPARRAALYLKAIAEAVHFAHQQGTLHRDIKPSNVIIDGADQPRITDFGLAKRIQADSELTASGQILGTPSYIPPEQAAGRSAELGPHSDVYSLGATLFQLLTGRPPFQGETSVDTLLHVIHNDPVAPRMLNPNIPRDLERICLQCLQKEPRRRYASAQALADDLSRFLEGVPIRARHVGHLRRLGRWCRRRPLVAGLSMALAAALLAGTTVSSYLAVRAHRSAELANAKAAEASEHLWQAYLAKAQSLRTSGQPGCRFKSLKALAAAAAIRPSPELRDEVIACLALNDLRLVHRWNLRDDQIALADSDGERYVVSTETSDLRICRMADNRELATLSSSEGRPFNYAFSPDGKLLAALFQVDDERQCRVWSLEPARLLWESPVGRDCANLDFSHDNRSLVFVGADGRIQFCESQSGSSMGTLSCQPEPDAVRFDPTGCRLAVWRWQQPWVLIIDVASGQVERRFDHPSGVYGVGWYSTGRMLGAACGDFQVHVWDVESGRQRSTLRGHFAEVIAVAFHPDCNLAASRSWDGTLRLWEPLAGKQLLSLQGGLRWMDFSGDGRWLTVRSFDRLERWEVALAECCTLIDPAAEKGPWQVHFHPEGRWLVSASDNGLRVWDAFQGRELLQLPIGPVESAVFAPDRVSLITTDSSGVQRWPLTYHSKSHMLQAGTPETLATPDRNGLLRAYANPDGKILIAECAGDQIRIRSLDNSSPAVWLSGGGEIAAYAPSPDALLAAIAYKSPSNVEIRKLADGCLIQTLPGTNDTGWLTFSPDGRWLVNGTDRDFRVWETSTWRVAHCFQRDGEGLDGPLAFSSDSRLVALAATRYLIQLRDVATGQCLAHLQGTDQPHLAWLGFSPDGSRLAAAGQNHLVHVWDLDAIRRYLTALGLD